MRVADQQLFDNVTSNLSQLREQSLVTQTQIATGKKINQPSDDPVGFGQVVSLKATMGLVDQRIRNIQMAQAPVNQADSTLGQVNDVLSQVKQLAVQAGSSTIDPAGRANMATQIQQLQQQLVQLGNTEANGQYIFAGTKTDQPPFVLAADNTVTYQGNSETQSVQVGDQETVQVALPGDQVFSGPQSNIFDTMKNLISSLQNNDSNGIEDAIGNLDQGMAQVTNARGEIGALQNRLTTALSGLQSYQQNATTTLSGLQDADLTQVYTDFSRQQLAYQATAQAASKIFDSTLLNFLQ